MRFCKVCENMYYLKISESGNELTEYCRNCGDTETNVTNICFDTNEDIDNGESYINRYTKLDPTLPRIHKIPCPNNDCETNTSDKPSEIILIRYDTTNLKYLYLCSICDHSWKTDIKN